MENTWRWVLVTAIAPVAWGSTYWVTREFLPPDAPLWGAVLRAIPAGLLLLAIRPRRPRGAWWWRAAVLGVLNVGVFFALIYLVAQLLPTSLASTIMATSPAAMMLLAWLFAGERLRLVPLLGAGLGIGGVALMLAGDGPAAAPLGIGASVLAMLLSSLGYILAKRWREGADVLSITSWQLVAGGLLLLPAALVVEGAPPPVDGPGLAAFAYVSVIATAVALAAWFAGLSRLPAGTVGLVGLLNPVTGVLLGVLVAGEQLGGRQLAGLAIVLVGIVLGQPFAHRSLARVRRRLGGRTVADGTDRRIPRARRTEVRAPLPADC
ncbi:ABC transporter permease [Agromyces luteolus]|uniref:EamA family transporter n=1 Tax=Agromyces luteolus TaxID=88373 RepID=A0A7C9LG05_9MICO|nr:EamA family transporter [Agromyces luteolus]MUN06675.1 EamA family transporter [Agromyces luteolus]GLK27811.1 ABC transporter permease [Agromyces luteolus]